MAAKYNIKVEQGETWRRRLVVKSKKTMRPVNLTGYAALMQVRATKTSEEVLMELTVGQGIAITPQLGAIDLEITIPMTLPLPFAAGVYDLMVKTPDGDVRRLLEGKITLDVSVSRKAF